jgi:hypothetical protein
MIQNSIYIIEMPEYRLMNYRFRLEAEVDESSIFCDITAP